MISEIIRYKEELGIHNLGQLLRLHRLNRGILVDIVYKCDIYNEIPKNRKEAMILFLERQLEAIMSL